MPESSNFDVFLSHNSRDKSAVRELAHALVVRGLRVWLDEWELLPGRSWQNELSRVLGKIRSIAVLIGTDGIGPWQILEQEAILRDAVYHRIPVIPVLLPNASGSAELPLFLANRTFVDLRNGLSNEGLDRLQYGITGIRPEPVQTSADRKQEYDVFFCFRETDRPAVQETAKSLTKLGVRCWPDDWSITSTESWRRLLSRRGHKIHALAVFAADDGGPWDDVEVETFIWDLIEDGQLVVPVILPYATRNPNLPVYLRRKQHVDLRGPNPAQELTDLLAKHRMSARGANDV